MCVCVHLCMDVSLHINLPLGDRQNSTVVATLGSADLASEGLWMATLWEGRSGSFSCPSHWNSTMIDHTETAQWLITLKQHNDSPHWHNTLVHHTETTQWFNTLKQHNDWLHWNSTMIDHTETTQWFTTLKQQWLITLKQHNDWPHWNNTINDHTEPTQWLTTLK